MSKKRTIPQTVQLYWQCQQCKVLKEWPKHWASLYCSNACKMKAYRRRLKRERGEELLEARDFIDELPESR